MTAADIPDLDTLAGTCAFVAEARRRWPDMDIDPDTPPALGREALPPDWHQAPQAALARLRQVAGCHILWRDLTGRADFEQTSRDLTTLAETCLAGALDIAATRIRDRFGVLADDTGRTPGLCILALGKLGGRELNFNSDIDLVFTYAGSGHADGPRRLEAREYLGQVGRELVGLLDSVTAAGRVWTVDTRLRPFGEAGALVWSSGAMEQYYLTEGRAWERYALIKARPVAGDIAAGRRLLETLQPFVYKRYLDYGVFDNLRAIQADIERTAATRDSREDIKRGPGGIRELEFMVQSLQLLRGGQDRRLRHAGFLAALAACESAGLIAAADELGTAYRFLRVLENRLQGVTGRQTHRLPDDAPARERLARAMGQPGWSDLARDVADTRTRVRRQFRERLLAEPDASADHPLWPPPADDTTDAVRAAGFRDAGATLHALGETARWLEHQPLSSEARRRLDRLMPLLLDAAAAGPDPDAGLPRLLELVRTVARRSAYLALLREQPRALERTVGLFSRSPALARMLIEQPQLLDDVIDPALSPARLAPAELDAILERRWRHCLGDPERCRLELSRFHKTRLLHVGLGLLEDRLDAPAAGAELARLAECVLAAALDQAGRELAQAGRPHPPVAVIAYGNLGGSALHFDSDLDLVFLHAPEVTGADAIRRVQRALHILDTPGPAGRLYAVDTRLRPNGRSGLLVSASDAYARYQAKTAWTWEHQALTRARLVAGDPELEPGFEAARREALARPRDPAATAGEVCDMFRRLLAEHRPDPVRKTLVQLQFRIQHDLLLRAQADPGLLAPRDLPGQIRALADAGAFSRQDAQALIRLLAALAGTRMAAWLAGEAADPDPVDPADTAVLERLWAGLAPAGADACRHAPDPDTG